MVSTAAVRLSYMPPLTAIPNPDELTLLSTVADGFRRSNSRWPSWQWVLGKLADKGVHGDEVVRRMQTWSTGGYSSYRSLRWANGTTEPRLSDAVQLTMHGLVFSSSIGGEFLSRIVVKAIEVARHKQLQDRPMSPADYVQCGLQSAELLNIATLAGSPTTLPVIFDLLQNEPDLCGGVPSGSRESIDWTWDLTSSRLQRYEGVATGEDYLAALETSLALAMPPVPIAPLPPMSLLDAIDHLSLAWRAVFTVPLIVINRAALPGRLMLTVNSFVELQSGFSAVADLLGCIKISQNPNETGGPLMLMERRLKAKVASPLPDHVSEAFGHLRSIIALRDHQQHSQARNNNSYYQAVTDLGLGPYLYDFGQQWECLRTIAHQSIRVIRHQVEQLIS